MRALVTRAVRDAGHEVVAEAIDADAAIDALARLRPSAVVIDGRLPPAGAPDAIARMRAVETSAAIFVLASLDERELVRAAIAAGARGALVRPLRPKALADALRGASAP